MQLLLITMAPRPYILAETNWKAIKDEKFELAVLPWGATEAHNYHLPYATDTIQCDYVAAEAAKSAWEKGAKVIVLPTVPFGVNTGQSDILLDLNINPSTQAAIIKDLVEVLHRQSIHKLLILNGHGGNNFKTIIREIGYQYENMFICACDWYRVVNWNDYFDEPGDHAGEMETSVMMHIAPHLVLPLSEAGDGAEKKSKIKGIREGWAWAERKWSAVSKDTGIGNPKAATAEKGKLYLDATAEKLADFFVELSHADIRDLYE